MLKLGPVNFLGIYTTVFLVSVAKLLIGGYLLPHGNLTPALDDFQLWSDCHPQFVCIEVYLKLDSDCCQKASRSTQIRVEFQQCFCASCHSYGIKGVLDQDIIKVILGSNIIFKALICISHFLRLLTDSKLNSWVLGLGLSP